MEGKIKAWCFIHIPKTAGTSFVSVFGRGGLAEYRSEAMVDKSIDQSWLDGSSHHQPATAIPADVTPVSILRNPFDRIVSICAYLHRALYPLLTPATFNQWVLDGLPLTLDYPDKPTTVVPPVWIPPKLRSGPDKVHASNLGWVGAPLTLTTPQTAWISPRSLLLRYETLEDDLRGFCRWIDRKPECSLQSGPDLAHRPLPHLNSSKRLTDHNDYYTTMIRKIIRTRYQEELSLWEKLRKERSNHGTKESEDFQRYARAFGLIE